MKQRASTSDRAERLRQNVEVALSRRWSSSVRRSAAACALASVPAASAFAWALDAPATVSVSVASFRNTTGLLGCRLYSSEKGFPTDAAGAMEIFERVAGGDGRCVFTPLPPGQYAVAVMHDENANHKLDTNWLGIPTEGYGASNNRTQTFSPPRWSESRFAVAAGSAVELRVTLNY